VSNTADIPQPPWQRSPKRASKKKREPITQEAIVGKAIEVLDAEGLDGLSMRRIAEELGTGAASLYWHVGSKDGLLDLVFDRIIAEQHVPDPEPGRWREQLKEVARNMRTAIGSHRDVVELSLGRIPMGPNALDWSERVLAILRSGAVPDRLAVRGVWLLTSVVNGFTMDENADYTPTTGETDVTDEAAQMASNYIASLPPERFPNMVDVADQYQAIDRDESFELLLDLFVDGLAQRAASESTHGIGAKRQAARPARRGKS
jgi:AcrR family transcriptional regulator